MPTGTIRPLSGIRSRLSNTARRTPASSASREIPTDPIDISDDDPPVPQCHIVGSDDSAKQDIKRESTITTHIVHIDDDGDDDVEELPEEPSVRVTRNRAKKSSTTEDAPKKITTSKNVSFGAEGAKKPRAQPFVSEKAEKEEKVDKVTIVSDDEGTPIRRRSSRRRAKANADPQLQKVLDKASTEEEKAEIKKAWQDPTGRQKVLDLNSVPSSDSSYSPSRRPRRRSRRLKSLEEKAAVHDVDAESDEHSSSDADAEPSGGKSLGKRTRSARTNTRRGVQLSHKNTLQNRLRSRGPIPNGKEPSEEGRQTRQSRRLQSQRDQQLNKSKNTGKNTRKSSRGRKDWASSDEDHGEDGDYSDYTDVIIEEEHVLDEDMEEEDGGDEGLELNDTDDEDDDDDDDDEDGPDDDYVEEEKYSRSRRVSKRRKVAKKNQRRKRTRPTDAFESNQQELTVQEQRERLDFLVNQSAEIAQSLHKAMAEATANQKPVSNVKSPQRRGAVQNTEGDESISNAKSPQRKDAAQNPKGDENGESKALDNPETPKEGDENQSIERGEEKFAAPTAQGRELQPHQLDGVKWLLTLDAQGLNAILADEMGLGKTIQTVAFLASLILSGSRGPHLVIAPKNVCDHWAHEVKTWYPGQIKVVVHLGPQEERLQRLRDVLEEDSFDIIVTSYETALRDIFTRTRSIGTIEYRSVLKAFRNVEFEYLVVDEAHRLKNDLSRFGQAIREYGRAQRRLLLTGTPLSNNLKELWSLMNVLNPRIFSSKSTFEAWFAAPFENGRGGRGFLTHAEQSVIVDRLHTILRPFFRRRVRADICPSYTSADEVVIRCPMSSLQKALMLHYQRRATDKMAGANNVLMAMRLTSSHPFILSAAFSEGLSDSDAARLVSCSGKFAFLYYSLPRLLAGGHRVLVFSQFKGTLDFIEDLLTHLDIKFGRLDGDTGGDERTGTITDFNAEGSELQVFLLTTRAGGVGLNLQTADTVILFDSDWNPSVDLQAVSRIQRIGQKRTVHILRLVTEMSVDDAVLERAKHKLRTQEVAVGAGKFNTSSGAALDQKMRQKDLEQLLQSLDMKNFLPTDELANNSENPAASGSPESVSPSRERQNVMKKHVSKWKEQLLRPGETSLPEIYQPSLWVDEVEGMSGAQLPAWLHQDANLVAAAKALNCRSRYEADATYKENVESSKMVGGYSKKDRASRARRNIVLDYGSDFDSEDANEDVSEEDPSASVEDCSDSSSDDISMDEDIPLMPSMGNQGDGSIMFVGASRSPVKKLTPRQAPVGGLFFPKQSGGSVLSGMSGMFQKGTPSPGRRKNTAAARQPVPLAPAIATPVTVLQKGTDVRTPPRTHLLQPQTARIGPVRLSPTLGREQNGVLNPSGKGRNMLPPPPPPSPPALPPNVKRPRQHAIARNGVQAQVQGPGQVQAQTQAQRQAPLGQGAQNEALGRAKQFLSGARMIIPGATPVIGFETLPPRTNGTAMGVGAAGPSWQSIAPDLAHRQARRQAQHNRLQQTIEALPKMPNGGSVGYVGQQQGYGSVRAMASMAQTVLKTYAQMQKSPMSNGGVQNVDGRMQGRRMVNGNVVNGRGRNEGRVAAPILPRLTIADLQRLRPPTLELPNDIGRPRVQNAVQHKEVSRHENVWKSRGSSLESKVDEVIDLDAETPQVEREGKMAEEFPKLVERLQEITKVEDVDFLVDALLESGGEVDGAADYVYSRIM